MSGLHVDMTAERDAFEVEVQLQVEPGEVAAIIGPNGAGKSTIVDAVAGLVGVTSGRIELAGAVLDDPAAGVFLPPRDRRIGVVFQDRILFPHLSALENVAFGLTARGVARTEAGEAGRRLLDALGLGDIADRNAADLSGGEAQRVALARALAIDPVALVLDEPLAALDASARVGVRRVLKEQFDAFGGPVVVVTHDATEAFLLADRVFVVEQGRLTQSGSPDDIRLQPRTRYAADFAGVNLIPGEVADGSLRSGDHVLQIADRDIAGDAIATIQPSAIAVYRVRPEGSPRNAWQTKLDRIERYGDRVRLHTGGPLPLTIEVTPGAVDALRLDVGADVWVSIKATEITVEPR